MSAEIPPNVVRPQVPFVKIFETVVDRAGRCQNMPFSFSANRRKEFNRQQPHVKDMLAAAHRYGFNRGSASDSQVISDLLDRFARSIPGASIAGMGSIGTSLARETVGSDYPTAVNAAWAVAVSLPSSTVSMLTREMGVAGVTNAATCFTDEFPGRVKTPVVGLRPTMWRGPAAIAAMILMAHAQEVGL